MLQLVKNMHGCTTEMFSMVFLMEVDGNPTF